MRNYVEYRTLELCNGKRNIDEIIDIVFNESNIDPLLIKERVNNTIDEFHTKGFLALNNSIPQAVDGSTQRFVSEFGFPAPVTVFWDLTSACNLKCPHCYARAGKKLDGELTTAEVYKVIDQLQSFNPYMIECSGGEPLLREDIFDILNYAKLHLTSKIKFLTNGLLINEVICKKLSKYVDFVHISIDGIGSSHDKFRGAEGIYEKTIAAIKLLVNKNVPVCITTTIYNKNIDEIPKIIDLALELKVKRMRFGFFTASGRGIHTHKDYLISKEKRKSICEYLVARKKELAGILGIDTRDRMYGSLRCEQDDNSSNYLHCRAGTRLMYINSRGYLTPCYMLNEPDFYLGNVKENDLESIWKNSNLLAEFRSLTVNKIYDCKDCKRKNNCGGGMRCGAYGDLTSLYAPDPDCPFFVEKALSVNE